MAKAHDFQISLSIIIPNRNEERVGELAEKLERVCRRDNRIREFEIHIVHDNKGNGYGHTIKRGVGRSTYDWICIIDADSTYSPWDLPRLLDELPYGDMVVSERRGTVGASGFVRSVGRRLVLGYARMRTGFPIIDINSGFRIFRRRLYDECLHMLPNRFSLTSTITLYAFYFGFSVRYVPIFYSKRLGKSKLRPSEFFRFINTINRVTKQCKKKLMSKTTLVNSTDADTSATVGTITNA